MLVSRQLACAPPLTPRGVVRRFLTWRALRYVNFPTQVLAKSCKALPIMAVNRLAGKKHSWMQYSSVSLITAGVVLFMMYREGMDHVEEQQNSLSGAVLLFFALGFDGLTGHLEDGVIKEMEWKHGQGTFDLMLYINLYAIPICVAYIVGNGELGILVSMSSAEMVRMLWLSLAGALGQMCIFYTLATFGALTCSLITTLRKMLQIGLSALAFGHTFTVLQLVGVGSTFAGVFLNMHDKRKRKTPSQVGAAMPRVGRPAVRPPNYDDNYMAATRSSV